MKRAVAVKRPARRRPATFARVEQLFGSPEDHAHLVTFDRISDETLLYLPPRD
jgi:hypothetical protein